jgi:hypothetical protein
MHPVPTCDMLGLSSLSRPGTRKELLPQGEA